MSDEHFLGFFEERREEVVENGFYIPKELA